MTKIDGAMSEFERLAGACDDAFREAAALLRLGMPQMAKDAEKTHREMMERIRQAFADGLQSNEPASASGGLFASLPEMQEREGDPADPLAVSAHAYQKAIHALMQHCFFVLEGRGSRKPN